jgi:catechol 2,3-dioxygenase
MKRGCAAAHTRSTTKAIDANRQVNDVSNEKRTAAKASPAAAPNLVFSHMGISVTDLDRMTDFYTRVLGFTITDRGEAAGLKLVFLSRDPADHHQIVLATGRPAVLPENTANSMYGVSINQISFKMGSIADLRDIKQRFEAEQLTTFPANHGIAWSVYAPDPEGNNLEFFVDSDWYFPQPFLQPLELTQSDADIIAETRALCESQKGFEPYANWRARIALRMSRFAPPTVGS